MNRLISDKFFFDFDSYLIDNLNSITCNYINSIDSDKVSSMTHFENKCLKTFFDKFSSNIKCPIGS
jgi:hypothetical protein